MRALIAFFASRALLVNMLVIVSLATGWIAARAMNAETMPELDLGVITVTTVYPGAGPKDVELSITDPLEDELEAVTGIDRIDSSSSEGVSIISIRLDPDLDDKTEVLADVRKAVDRGALQFPDQVREKPEVDEGTTGELSIVELHLSGPIPEATLRSLADRFEDGLTALPGVGRVTKVGYRERELRILLDPARVQRRSVRYAEIVAAIRGRQVRASGGAMESFLTERQVLTVAGFEDESDVEDVIVRSTDVGNSVRVGDLGIARVAFEDWRTQARANGELAIILEVRKRSAADTLDTAADVRAYVEAVREDLPPGVMLEVVNDTSRFTRDMLDTLIDNALMGVALVFVVLLLFFDLRISFWVAMGLPISVGLAFAGMHGAGLGLDLITLMALLLMLGMLVDDAIVTGESIYQFRERGLPALEASVSGTHAVTAPVITSVATTALAFAPLLFMAGIEGKLLRSIPIVVGLTLAASLVECKLMLPAHLAHGKPSRPRAWFERVRAVYDRLVEVLVRRRYITASLFVVGAAAVASLAIARVPFNLFPATDADLFVVKLELPLGTPLERTAERAEEVATAIREAVGEGDLLGVSTQVGHHDVGLGSGGRHAEWAVVWAYLEPAGTRVRKSAEIVEGVRVRLQELQGFKLLELVERGGGPTSGQPIEVTLKGPDEQRLAVADILIEFLRGQPGVTTVESSYEAGKPVIEVTLRQEALAARNVSETDITDAIRVAFDGTIVGEFRIRGEDLPFRLQFDDSSRASLETLESLVVVSRTGKQIPLSALVSISEQPGIAEIRRIDGRPSTTVFGDIDRDVLQVEIINDRIVALLDEQRISEKFPDVLVSYGGELEQQQAAIAELGLAFVFCLGLIAMALVLLFGSLTQPLLVMLVIPFGIVGALTGLMIQGIDISIIAGVGFLGLAGVLVNDAVVMISAMNDARGTRERLTEPEICAGASTRLRPVIITSVTTTAGLVPTIVGATGSTQFIVPMISTLAWGVVFGTVVTLGLLPAVYAIEQDLRGWLARVRLRIRA